MANTPNRKTPRSALTHSRLADYSNQSNITPKFFIPKKPFDKKLATRFRKSQLRGDKPYISYDPETRIFVCHGFENDLDNDDCMNLLLKFQLVPMNFKDGRNKIKRRLVYYIPPEDVIFYTAKHYKANFVPDSVRKVMKADQYDELKIFTAYTKKKK